MLKKIKIIGTWLLILFGMSVFSVKNIAAVEQQHCISNNTCVIGEFLYDDNYAPMTDATCKLTSKFPDGSTFLNAVTMTAGNDGWYSYTLNLSGHPDGLYPSQVCCDTTDTPSQHLCLDKTFLAAPATLSSSEVSNAVWDAPKNSHTTSGTFGNNLQNSVSTPQQIWAYTDRTLTGFGTLVADIWGYTGRSLDSFGTLVTAIWNNSSRTLTSAVLGLGGQLTIKSETESAISASTSSIKGASNKDLTSLTTDVAGVQTTVTDISSKVDTLQSSVNTINTNVNSLVTKWGSYSASDIITNIGTVTTKLGTTSDTCLNNTVFGNIQCVKDKWGSQTADALYTAANNAYTTISSLRSEVSYNGKSTTAYQDLQSLVTSLSSLSGSVGSPSDSTSTTTLFGKINKTHTDVAGVQTTVNDISSKIDTLQTSVDSMTTNISTLVSKWGAYSASDIITNLSTVTTRLGTTSDTCLNNTVFGNIQCVKDKWGSQTADALYTAANNAYTTVSALRTELNYNGKSTTAYQDLQTLKTNLSTVNTSIGTSTDASSVASLFGKIKKTQEDVAGVQTTVDSIETKVDTLQASINTIDSNISTLISKWGAYSMNDVITQFGTVTTKLGTTSDTCLNNTIFGNIQCVRDKWGSQTADGLYTAANNAYVNASALRTELDYNGKSSTAFADLQTIKTSMTSLSSSVGTSSDSSTTGTLFGRVKKVQDTVEALNTANVDVTALLDKWGSYSATDIYSKINDISTQITDLDASYTETPAVTSTTTTTTSISSNDSSNISSILSIIKSSSNDTNDLKNSVLGLKAAIDVTKQLIEKTNDKPIVKTWLEEGSIIFKTLITNPSDSITQVVPVKYYLPKEAVKDDVIKMDKELSMTYDPTQESSYVSADIPLQPGQSRVLSIEVKDVWNYSDSQLSSSRMQAEQLFAPLKKTSYFAQGATLESDIIASLDTIDRLQKEAVTPDQRIQAYRESTIEFDKADSELKDLKTLVTSAGSVGTMFGFVGGIQTASTWGIIIIVITGFVFLTIFMRKLNNQKIIKTQRPQNHTVLQLKTPLHKNRAIKFALFFILSFSITAFATNLVYEHSFKKTSTTSLKNIPSLGDQHEVLGAEASHDMVSIVVPKDVEGVNVRELPSLSANLITKITSNSQMRKYAEVDGWVEVGINITKNNKTYMRGWINKQFIQE